MRSLLTSSFIVALLVVGCAKGPEPRPPAPADAKAGASDSKSTHSHERGKMLIADAGKYHALLTAHLSPKGNELDIFFETTSSKDPKPVALPIQSFTAYAQRASEDKRYDLKFECAPAEERPKDEKPGTCSHFVAKADWMKPTDDLAVVFHLELDGKRYRVLWEKFIPKKYAHHEE